MLSFASPLYEVAFNLAKHLCRYSEDGDGVHQNLLKLLHFLDGHPELCQTIGERALPDMPTHVGGVDLPTPLIVGAGIVKNGWLAGYRCLPALAGAVEFGSFTSYPIEGNSGNTISFNGSRRSMFNRVGLRNHGALQVSETLREIEANDPIDGVWGVSIAPTTALHTEKGKADSIRGALEMFDTRIEPYWYTINLSCPTAENSNRNNDERVILTELGTFSDDLPPVWVKVAPGLDAKRYRDILRLCVERNVKAVIATNSQAVTRDGQKWGMSGGDLTSAALNACRVISEEISRQEYPIDLIGCGGILDGQVWSIFHDVYKAKAGMYTSALYFRGLLAGSLILKEYEKHKRDG